ncbi:MAG: hypothetical protein LBT46_12070 [Planctomycetaceae bacterium]|nr:hypothetical protein [Planctomycetaceae bacterium]
MKKEQPANLPLCSMTVTQRITYKILSPPFCHFDSNGYIAVIVPLRNVNCPLTGNRPCRI